MIIEKNGIKINAEVEGSVLKYQVLKQKNSFTNALGVLGIVEDPESGFRMKTNLKPYFKPSKKRNVRGTFYVRGKNHDEDDNEIEIEFGSQRDAEGAIAALQRMIDKVEMPEGVVEPIHDDVAPQPGGTTDVRMALISKSQAEKLSLTAKRFWPEQYRWACKPPIRVADRHYGEHIGQVVDVLNKAHNREEPRRQNGIVNPHYVTHEQARKAVNAFKQLFNDAERDDYLVAIWRLVSGMRGPDDVRLH